MPGKRLNYLKNDDLIANCNSSFLLDIYDEIPYKSIKTSFFHPWSGDHFNLKYDEQDQTIWRSILELNFT